MTRVAILPVPGEEGRTAFRAISGQKQFEGSTAGEALDGLSALLPEDQRGTMIIVQRNAPDEFFGADDIRRLEELMARWRACRDANQPFDHAEQAELEALVEKEPRASGQRAASLADQLGR